MASVRGRDTKPEMIVRRLIHGLGYRYRLHDRTIPGSPDLVFAGRRRLIFVNGCFWHRHDCKAGKDTPKSNEEFWTRKLERNRERDEENLECLKQAGWKVLVIWECQMGNLDRLKKKVERFLGPR